MECLVFENPNFSCSSLDNLFTRPLASERHDHSREMPTGDHEQDPPSLLLLISIEVIGRQLQLLQSRQEIAGVRESRRKEGTIEAQLSIWEERSRRSEPDESRSECGAIGEELSIARGLGGGFIIVEVVGCGAAGKLLLS